MLHSVDGLCRRTSREGDNAMNRAGKSYLIPVRELLPSEITRIRREAINRVVAMASTELKKPPSELVVRDIRPYSDLDWCTDATAFSAALTVESWCPTLDQTDCLEAYHGVVSTANQTMEDSRWVCITGVKDFRLNEASPVLQAINFLKIEVGGNERVIWDLQGLECYPNLKAAITPAPVVIPQNTAFNIYIYMAGADEDDTECDVLMYLVIDGFVVEPRGKVISP